MKKAVWLSILFFCMFILVTLFTTANTSDKKQQKPFLRRQILPVVFCDFSSSGSAINTGILFGTGIDLAFASPVHGLGATIQRCRTRCESSEPSDLVPCSMVAKTTLLLIVCSSSSEILTSMYTCQHKLSACVWLVKPSVIKSKVQIYQVLRSTHFGCLLVLADTLEQQDRSEVGFTRDSVPVGSRGRP